MARHGVYPIMQTNGSALAIREGRYLYYGPVPSGNSIATISSGWISIGSLMNTGYSDYRLEGNTVYAGGGGQTVFTIRGDYIHDGIGSTPFLYCPTGDKEALAMAACCFVGDMRLRMDGATPVEAERFAQRLSPNISGNSNHRGEQPRIDRLDGKTSDHERKYGNGRSWDSNANNNFDQMKKPVSGNPNYNNGGYDSNSNSYNDGIHPDVGKYYTGTGGLGGSLYVHLTKEEMPTKEEIKIHKEWIELTEWPDQVIRFKECLREMPKAFFLSAIWFLLPTGLWFISGLFIAYYICKFTDKATVYWKYKRLMIGELTHVLPSVWPRKKTEWFKEAIEYRKKEDLKHKQINSSGC
jgi:hypothetical protein